MTGDLPQEGTELLVSHDGGASWNAVAAVPIFTTLVVDPRNADRLVAAADYTGFWRSLDGGETWVNVYDEFLIGEGLVALDANDPGVIVIASPARGVLASRDDGAHWRELPPNDLLGTVDHFYPALVTDPLRAGKVYLANWNGIVTTTVR